MNKNAWKKWIGVAGRMLVAYALILTQGAWAGQDQKTKDKAAAPQNAAAEQTSEKHSGKSFDTMSHFPGFLRLIG